MFEHSEHLVRLGVEWLRLLIEGLGAVTIFLGLLATLRVLRKQFAMEGRHYSEARVTFAQYLTFALELQLAADVLSTSVSPSWEQIGKLAAIAIIRTALNFFLQKEMQEKGDTEPEAARQSASS